MADALTEQEKETLLKHFDNRVFVEVFLKFLENVKAADMAKFSGQFKSDFDSEAMSLICAKAGCMALDRLGVEIKRLAEVAEDNIPSTT